jgi:hypothetical protein
MSCLTSHRLCFLLPVLIFLSLSSLFPPTTHFRNMKPNLNQGLLLMERVLRQGRHQNVGKKQPINTAMRSFENVTKSVGTTYRYEISIQQEINSR